MFWNEKKREVVSTKRGWQSQAASQDEDFWSIMLEITEVLLCWGEHKADKYFCSQEWPIPLSPHLSEDFHCGELSFRVHKLKQKPPTTLRASPIYCIFPPICILCLGFSLWCFLEQKGSISLCSWCSHSPSGQGGGLKILTKCSKSCFCAIKRLQKEQITLFLGALHIPPLATSWAAACSGGFLYKK